VSAEVEIPGVRRHENGLHFFVNSSSAAGCVSA
jgi:hypothetical protein